MCLAVPGEVVSCYEKRDLPYGEVSFGGVRREVCMHCVPGVTVGDFVLVHVGLAIARLDRAEAERAWTLLRELGQEEEARMGERS
jgi:hydrogenase expression/formation protein HypC